MIFFKDNVCCSLSKSVFERYFYIGIFYADLFKNEIQQLELFVAGVDKQNF